MGAVPPAVAIAPLPIVIVGHVDHGKSTLVGRLLHDTNSLPDGKVEELKRVSDKRGATFEWSFVMDALQIERDQGITVDTTRIWFRTARRPYVIIDAPGHKEFLRNMVTGAASADAAILVIDVAQGVSEQTRRHAYLLGLLGIRQVLVAVNKMDLVGYDRVRFDTVSTEIKAYLARLGIVPQAIIPIAARHGTMVAERGIGLEWWAGDTLIGALDSFKPHEQPVAQPLRMPVQDLYRDGDRRIIVGRIESGRLKVGDPVRFAPGGRVARVASIETWNAAASISAAAGQSVAFAADEEVFVERGHLVTSPDAPPQEAHAVRARLFWLDRAALRIGDKLTMKLATASYPVTVEAIDRVIDVQDFQSGDAVAVESNGIAEVVFRSPAKIVFDRFVDNPETGRAVLVREYRVVGGCLIDGIPAEAATNLTAVNDSVSADERASANGHRGGVLWLTGLSGAGKSTLAMALQRRLFERGYQVFVLDGDNVRLGLNRDLGFSDADRSENIRRTAEVARLLAEAGQIVIASFISPRAEHRTAARSIIGPSFQEVYVKASVETCAARDPKGLYAKARAGELPGFTGIDSAYEIPVSPDLLVDTEEMGVDTCLVTLLQHVGRQYGLRASQARASGQ